MRIAKRFIIWAVIMLIIVFCINIVGTVLSRFIFANMLMPAMTGYVSKSEAMIHPKLRENDGKSKGNGLESLVVRSLLDNERLELGSGIISTFLFMNMNADQSVIFFDQDGMNDFSNGTFADVFEEKDSKISYMLSSVGLLPVNEFIKLDGADDLYDILKNEENCKIRVDSYTDNNFIIMPVKLTVLDENGSEIKKFEFQANGDVIRSGNIYIYDDNSSSDKQYKQHGFFKKMEWAYLGKRQSDRAAEKLVKKVSLESDTYVKKNGYGIGHFTSKSYEVKDGRAMITVFDFSYYNSLILYTAIAAIPVTLIVFLVGRRKKNDY